MPLSSQQTNQSYYISDNKSITFWIGGFTEESGDETRKIKYIVRDHESNTWGIEEILFDLSAAPFSPFYSFLYTDFIFKRINDNKIFIAVRPPGVGLNPNSAEKVIYTFGTISGNSISFSEPKILLESDEITAKGRSISALVVNNDQDPEDFVILFSFVYDTSFLIYKITESQELPAISPDGLVFSPAGPFYTKLIKKDNLVLAMCTTTYINNATFRGRKPVIKAYNYNTSSKILSETESGFFYIPNISITESDEPQNYLNIFFTGEDYNFMITSPDRNTSIPA